MEPKNNFRHELKYSISYGDYLAMSQRLKRVMLPDPNASENGKYIIRSVYFDNFKDKALFENQEEYAES